MATDKIQHYVPRVHLKPFTLDGKGHAINLMNIDRVNAIRNARVRNQCSGDYIYWMNELLERAINSIENPYGEMVRALADVSVLIDTVTATVRSLWHDYKAAKANLRTIREIERVFDRHILPTFGDRAADKITRGEITRFIDEFA